MFRDMRPQATVSREFVPIMNYVSPAVDYSQKWYKLPIRMWEHALYQKQLPRTFLQIFSLSGVAKGLGTVEICILDNYLLWQLRDCSWGQSIVTANQLAILLKTVSGNGRVSRRIVFGREHVPTCEWRPSVTFPVIMYSWFQG